MIKLSPVNDKESWVSDHANIQSNLDNLASIAKAKNKNETLVLTDGVYYLDKPLVITGGVSFVSEGKGRRSVRLVFTDPQSDTALVTVKNCNGIVFDGINIKAFGEADRVIGLLSNSNSSSTFSNFDIELQLGNDCIGLKHQRDEKWGESCIYEKFDIRSGGACVEIQGGDNNQFRDFDCRAGTKVINGASAVFRFAENSVPHNIVIGPGSGQKGNHAYYCNSVSDSVAGGLITFRDYRWEQPQTKNTIAFLHTPKRKDGKPGHVTERINFIGCRSTRVNQAVKIENTLRTRIMGCFLMGSKDLGK